MEWKSTLRRTQSLKSLPSSCDKPVWTDTGLRDRMTSVSQLVARYQTTASVDHGEGKPEQMLQEKTPSFLHRKETHLESLLRRNEERERTRTKASLTRAKSMSSLRNSTGSIMALKARFESKSTTESKAKTSFRAANFASPYKADLPVMNGEVEDVKSAAEEHTTIKAVDKVPKTDAKEDHVTQKVVKQTRVERRKTIGGIDFEKNAASQADEKRRSIADFRESSFIQTKEKLSVSVKAMSALYLSKVAPQESANNLLKPERAQSRESGKRGNLSKMAEGLTFQQRQDGLPPPPSVAEDISGAHYEQPMPSQFSKEMLYQRRQKCELRRLLKHTHPELKMLDDVVDEELAEVLSSEGETAGETGYEGEVFSRRMIFENSGLSSKVSPYTPKMHMAEGTVERCDIRKMSAVFEEPKERPHTERVKVIIEDHKSLDFRPDLNRECEEEMTRIDVQAARRIFESQSVNTSRPNPDNDFQGKVCDSWDETKAVQKQKKQFGMCSKENSHNKSKSINSTWEEQPCKQVSCGHAVGQSTKQEFSGSKKVFTNETLFEEEFTSFPDSEQLSETIKTSAALFQNNPFIPTNIEREHSYAHTSKTPIPVIDSGAGDDYLAANVKNRAHLFESMPFDKIRQQNKDEIETKVENIKETLAFLYTVNAIHSSGSIIEVNETMIARKAKFTLSVTGPEINYEEVAEGGAQNFVLQLLPRVNLKPQITYLKEDRKGCMKATVVNVPVHQRQITSTKDPECKTANVVQLIEDILNRDNSLRKGVIIQDVNNRATVIVYSLYNYFDEEDVKSYIPSQGAVYDEPQSESADMSKTDNKETRKCIGELSQDQTQCSVLRPEVTMKGNVKLLKSCIEKGDLEYFKTLQAEPTAQEQALSQNQMLDLHHEQRGDHAEESTSEWVPVDVKRLKSIFSGDQSQIQPKQNFCETCTPSPNICHAFTGQNVSSGKSQSTAEFNIGEFSHGQKRECADQAQETECNFKVAQQASYLHFQALDDDRVHQAELVQVVDDNDEISNLHTAIHDLQQATIEARSLHQSSQQKQNRLTQESPEEPIISNASNEDQKVDSCTEPRWVEYPSSSSGQNSDCQHHQESNADKAQTTEIGNKKDQKGTDVVQNELFEAAMVSAHSSETALAQQEDEEVIFQGKIQAALQSLEKSNINVTKGDFRAAMIYRNSSKPHQERSQNVTVASAQKPIMEEFCHTTEAETPQVRLSQEVTAVKAEPIHQSESPNKPATCAVLEKNKRPIGSKPIIPPKPEHLTMKQRTNQSTSAKNPHEAQTNTVRPKDTVKQAPQSFPKISVSCEDELKQDMITLSSDPPDYQRNYVSGETVEITQGTEVRHQVQGSAVTLESDSINRNTNNGRQGMNAATEEKSHQDLAVKDNTNEKDECHVEFHEACQKFGGKKASSIKTAPVKPKRVKIARPVQIITDHSCDSGGQSDDSQQKTAMKQESRVEMRGKKGRTETEDERRQRLSVHMDEIMRGNITAAMEIFDNLRKQEELQSILCRVEQIEQDTSKVDVRSLRRVFENVPDWVVSSDKKKETKVNVENIDNKLPSHRDNAQSKTSVANVFGDLERASEEIMNLKEQTLARLLDIEEAIKKALYSVSTLKSDSDIAGLSCLFKESLGAVQGSPSSGNISKISIGSSRTKSQQAKESTTTQGNAIHSKAAGEGASIEAASAKQRASPPSSPTFISIQSAVRHTDKADAAPAESFICQTCQQSPKVEEKFRTTKTLTCNSPTQSRRRDPRKGGQKLSTHSPLNPNRELSVLEVQTDHEGKSILGTKTVTENYERTDNFGNRFYSSKTSTVVTTQPETTTSSTSQAVMSQAPVQVTTYPEVQLPVNQMPK